MELTKQRERMYSWGNPFEGVELSKELSGMEYLQAIQKGAIPASPLINTLDFFLGELEEGKVDGKKFSFSVSINDSKMESTGELVNENEIVLKSTRGEMKLARVKP